MESAEQGESVMVTVEQAVEDLVRREVALAQAWGQRVWIRRCPQADHQKEGRYSFDYLMALDDQRTVSYALMYRGRIDDLAPKGCEDFTLYFDGGKEDDLGMEPPAGMEPVVRPEQTFYAQDGTLLKFVTRIDSPEALPAVYLAA
jgi:hypothetical protein